jgi:selenide,water dikinase
MIGKARLIKRLVLVGAGHSHLAVLRSFAMDPLPEVEIVLVSPATETIYSGMLPGFVAGQYKWDEICLDAGSACVRAGAVFVRDEAVRIDGVERKVFLAGRPALHFDLLSVDIGSAARLPELGEGVLGPQFLATRPFLDFRSRLKIWDQLPGSLLVLGGGHAGFELACGFRARYPEREISLVDGGGALSASLRRELDSRRIHLLKPGKIQSIVREGERLLCRGEAGEARADLVVSALGAKAHPLVAASNLPEKEGYLLVGDTLQVKGFPIFGAGDCVRLLNYPWVPKSGVYAVREAPVLAKNLRAALAGSSLKTYSPQKKSLRLLNSGDGRALALRGEWEQEGRLVFRLKDFIDRRFVSKFRPEVAPLDDPDCGGCGSKVGAGTLRKMLAGETDSGALLWGVETAEDVTLWKTSGATLGLTFDQFKNFGVDPWLFGRIAALSAASDLYAKGIQPQGALMALTVPKFSAALGENWLEHLFAGARSIFADEGIQLGGGQTNEGDEWNLGFSFWGEAIAPPLSKKSGRAGDHLVITKPIGTGILLAAAMAGAPLGRQLDTCLGSMALSQKNAADVLRGYPVTACTDITGFSLLGHLSEMLGGELGAEVVFKDVPLLPGAKSWFEKGFQSRMHALNAAAFPSDATPEGRLLYDPQTAGGLLFAIDPNQTEAVCTALKAAGVGAWKIGALTADQGSAQKLRVIS